MREERRAEDVLAHDECRHQVNSRRLESYDEALSFTNDFPAEDDVETMNDVCKRCSALHYKGELATRKIDKFEECCRSGKVQLPDLQPYPS
uniref:Uncharacterized protein n=1 Tax=Plectus sambesii TaxID=2011161 RepID=A0A914XDY8_9BILA